MFSEIIRGQYVFVDKKHLALYAKYISSEYVAKEGLVVSYIFLILLTIKDNFVSL